MMSSSNEWQPDHLACEDRKACSQDSVRESSTCGSGEGRWFGKGTSGGERIVEGLAALARPLLSILQQE